MLSAVFLFSIGLFLLYFVLTKPALPEKIQRKHAQYKAKIQIES